MRLAALLAAALLFAAAPARAEEPTGAALLVTGGALVVAGIVLMASAPACSGLDKPGAVQSTGATIPVTSQQIGSRNACALGVNAGGGTLLALSLPAFGFGATQRLAWLGKIRPTVTAQGAALSWSGSF